MHAGILEVLHCILIESPEALNLIAEGHIKSIISLLDKHGRNHKVGVERIPNRDWLYLPFPSLLLSNYCVLRREHWLLSFLALIFFKQIKKKKKTSGNWGPERERVMTALFLGFDLKINFKKISGNRGPERPVFLRSTLWASHTGLGWSPQFPPASQAWIIITPLTPSWFVRHSVLYRVSCRNWSHPRV